MSRRKQSHQHQQDSVPKAGKNHRGPKKDIEVTPKTAGQEEYIESILNNDITICDGAPGTGKTHLAVGMGLKLLREHPNIYKRIVMVRPAVVVKGEDMGFLPGDADDKMAPFIAPILDSLTHFLNQGEIQSLVDSGCLEVIPIAFMRGRTLGNAIIIFDEAQNARWEHMKMFLTRLGFNAKAIVEGDTRQSDLDGSDGVHNGLRIACEKFDGGKVEGIQVVRLVERDIVRSPIVARLINYL